MEVNWLAIGVVIGCAIVLVAFLVKQNRRDEKKVEEGLKNDYNSIIEEEDELDDEDDNK